MIDRGRFLPGSLISLPTYVVSSHPSYAHKTPIMATPNGLIHPPSEPGGQSGRKFAGPPPANTNAVRMSAARAPILRKVSTFCVVAPSRTPKQLRSVSPAIDDRAPALIAAGASGTKHPAQVANPT